MEFARCTLAWVLIGTLFGAAERPSTAQAPPSSDRERPPDAVEAAAPPAAAAPDFGQTLELDALVSAVLARNPSLVAAEAALRAARARADVATALEDPSASAMVAPLSVGGRAPFGYEVRVSQHVPFPGKRALRGEVARDGATAAEARLQAARLDLAARAAELYADAYLNARALEVNAEHVALLRAFKEVATARYAAGLVPQQAPIQAEVEAARMLHHEIELEATGRTIDGELRALLHLPAGAPLPAPPPVLPPPPPVAMESQVDETASIARRPELLALQAEIRAREGELELAKRMRQPDFEVMTGYSSMWDTPEHRWTAGVGINLPIHRARIGAEVVAAEARLEQAQAELEQLTDTLRAEALGANAHLVEMAHLVELYRDRVLPAASDQVAAARASFESGAESMLGLIEAERSLRDAQQESHEAIAGFVRAEAKLARALGKLPGAAISAATPEEN